MTKIPYTVNEIPAVTGEVVEFVRQTRTVEIAPAKKTITLTLDQDQAMTLQIIIGHRLPKFDKKSPAGGQFTSYLYRSLQEFSDILGTTHTKYDMQFYKDEQTRTHAAAKYMREFEGDSY